ncbi:hypothetical protein [Pantoea stewartii]|uniref:hypothetical protein n=1 Tax=Pantoea stewartii TaxID=66269 RepID=UPI00092E6A11|nr:hypothetical protein [Pantoea stewartii]
MNSLTEETTWKILAAALPVIASVFQAIRFIMNSLRDGSLYKLKKIDKEFSKYLGDSEENKLLKKKIVAGVGARLCGVNNPVIRKRLVYVLNRSEINIPPFWAVHIGRYLEFDGKRFYFNFSSKKFLNKRAFFRFMSLVYFLYAIFIWWVYFYDDNLSLPLWSVIIFSILLTCVSFFCFGLLPSNKYFQGMNGSLVKVDVSEYKK